MTTKQPQFRYVNEAVGGFVLLTILIFIIAIVQSARIKEWFDPGETLRVNLPGDGLLLLGLSEGSVVEILGTKVGEVHKIVVRDNRQTYAEVHLNRVMLPFVRRDSEVFIRKRFGVTGNAYMDISRGIGTKLDWEYAVLDAEVDRTPIENANKVINEIRSKVMPIIDDSHQVVLTLMKFVEKLNEPQGILQSLMVSVNSIMSNVNSTTSNVNSITSNVSSITGKVDRGQGTVGRLFTEDKLAQELEKLLAQINKDSKRLGPIMQELQKTTHNITKITANTNTQIKTLPKITQNVQKLLVSLQVITKNLNRTIPQLPKIAKDVGKAMSDTPVLLLQTQQVMIELEQLLKQLQSHWLLGGKANPPPSTRISPLDVRP